MPSRRSVRRGCLQRTPPSAGERPLKTTHTLDALADDFRGVARKVRQRQGLYLGEINASQREAWRKTIEVQEAGQRRQVALFPAGSMPGDDVDAVGVWLSQLRIERPRQWGGCWLALQLWQQLELDSLWRPRLRPSREGTPWLKVLKTLVVYRLIVPGSDWRLHRQRFDSSAMADLLESDFALAEKNTPYQCLDRLHAACCCSSCGRTCRASRQRRSRRRWSQRRR